MAKDDKEEHVAVYDKVLKAIPTKYIHQQKHLHGPGLGKAMATLEKKQFTTKKEGIEALLEGYLVYANHMKDKTVLQKKDKDFNTYKHRYISDITTFLTNYEKQMQSQGHDINIIEMLRNGDAHKLMQAYLDTKHRQDLDNKTEYEVAQIIPDSKDPKFYQNLLKHHFKRVAPKQTLEPGFIEQAGTHTGVIEALKTSLRKEKLDETYFAAKYKPPK